MAVTYSYEVSNQRLFGLFRLLLKWAGSIWKVLLLDMGVYFITYAAIRIFTMKALEKDQLQSFDEFCLILKKNLTKIPLAFLLGFFVSHVYSRWWAIYNSIPWPYAMIDSVCLTLKVPDSVPEDKREEKQQEIKIIVQTVSRYMHLCLAMALRDICFQFRELMKKRKLTFVDMGLASELEMRKLYSTQELMDFEQKKLDWDSNKVNEKKRCAGWTWWVPATWASRLVRDAYDRGYIDSHENVTYVYEKIHQYKGSVGGLVGYDWICVPLPYSQVVALGVYAYFFLALFAYQAVESIESLESSYDKYFVPGALALEFIIYYGWFKVAEVLLTPYGSDMGYAYDMVGIFAMQLEQARCHVEYSFSLDDFLKKDPDGNLKALARVPLEQLFVKNIKQNMFGSLVQGIIEIPEFILDTSAALWKLPRNIWNNKLFTDDNVSSGHPSKPSGSSAGGGRGTDWK